MVGTLSNGTIWINGRNWLGSSKTIELPEITAITDDFEGLGFYGTLETFTGIEAMTMTIEWIDINAQLFGQFTDLTSSSQLQVRGSIQEEDSRGRTQDKPYLAIMTARPKMIGLGELAKAEILSTESEWAVSRLKLRVDNRDILEIDVTANIYSVNGQDRLARYRRNLGMTI